MESEVEKQDFITNYFVQLFKSSANGDQRPLLDAAVPKVTEEMNEGFHG